MTTNNSFFAMFDVLPTSVKNRISSIDYVRGLLDAHYGLPVRHYHNYRHLCNMMFNFRALCENGLVAENQPFRDEMYVAIMFHDVIYDVHAKPTENEEHSALFALLLGQPAFALGLSWNRISDLISATTHRTTGLTDPAKQLIADLDLAGLGTTRPGAFEDDSERVIEEYSCFFPEKLVITGRIEWIRTFLARPFIFYDQDRFDEGQARKNLKAEIGRLQEKMRDTLASGLEAMRNSGPLPPDWDNGLTTEK